MLNIKQVRERYKVASSTIYRWLDGGIFPKPVKISDTVRWREQDLDAFDKTGEVVRMQIDERGMQETKAEAKSELGWTNDLSGLAIKEQELKKQYRQDIRTELGLRPDASEYEVLIAIKALRKVLVDRNKQ